jgi:hypothetical protein
LQALVILETDKQAAVRLGRQIARDARHRHARISSGRATSAARSKYGVDSGQSNSAVSAKNVAYENLYV